MIAFPNCKINLGLKIISRRDDGYHNISTVFYPVGLTDMLEIVEAENRIFSFASGGIKVGGDTESNLCVKAYRLMKEKYHIPAIKIYLHKAIPHGAGLGGGSSDATFTVRLINEIFDLKLSISELTDTVNCLGSDCAFFIHNKPIIAYGRGNVFKDVSLSLKGYYIIIIFPGIQISTAEAYSNVNFSGGIHQEIDVSEIDTTEWSRYLGNDFEDFAFNKYPLLSKIKEILFSFGADYASMSGSGSAIFGLFKKKPDLNKIRLDYHMWQGLLA